MSDQDKFNTGADEDASVLAAFTSVRASLRRAPAFVMAVALTAGLTAEQARAWGNDFENLGRVIGGEVGRSASGDRYGSSARIGGLVGEVVGSRMGRPMDAADREAKNIAEIERRAREQAIRDAAYEAQRRKIDPNYSGVSRLSQSANVDYGSISANFQRLSDQIQAPARDYPRQR